MDSTQRRNFSNALSNFCPEEIITDILSRLSVKKLVQLKVVCKRWNQIISSNFFVTYYHLPQMKRLHQVFFMFQKEYGFWPLSYYKPAIGAIKNRRMTTEGDNSTEILGTCNSLVCVCNIDDNFWLWNPSTGENVSVPSSLITFPDDCIRSCVFFGLGYDSIADDYKLVRVVMFSTIFFKTKVQVFSRNLNAWRRIGDFPYEYPLGMPGVFVHGRIHWQVSIAEDRYAIASLDCHTETYDLIRFPFQPDIECRYYDIGSLDDERLIIYPTFCKAFESLNFWILQEYGNDLSWTRIHFAPGYDPIPDNGIITSIQPLYLSKPDNETILFRIDPWGNFVEYNLDGGYYQPVEAPEMGMHFCTVFRVWETLVNPGTE